MNGATAVTGGHRLDRHLGLLEDTRVRVTHVRVR
jgi:hypothetical protein